MRQGQCAAVVPDATAFKMIQAMSDGEPINSEIRDVLDNSGDVAATDGQLVGAGAPDNQIIGDE